MEPSNSTMPAQATTKKNVFAGSKIEGSHWTGSPRHDPPLTFGIELEVILAYDLSSFERDGFMIEVAERLCRRANILQEIAASEKQMEDVPKPANLLEAVKIMSELEGNDEEESGVPPPALWLAEEILRREGLKNSIGRSTECEAYSGWTLVEDSSMKTDDLWAEAQRQLPRRFGEQGLKHLFSGGVELVSRKLPAPSSNQDSFSHPSLEEVRDYIVALTGEYYDPYGCITNETCGLHCHVGAAAQENPAKSVMFPLGVLQHLCYILLHYETVISSLFPPWRRGTDHKQAPYLGSNLMGVRNTRHVCECYADTFTEYRLYKIEAQIFAPDMTVDRLCAIMGALPLRSDLSGEGRACRYKFVNFENLSSTNRPKNPPLTLEFRQHESTVDPLAIKHWILFVLSLVRAAEHKFQQTSLLSTPMSPTVSPKHLRTCGQRQTQNYKRATRILDGGLDDLFDLFDLLDHQREYWLGRFKRFNPEEENVEQNGPTLDPAYWASICPECYIDNLKAQDNYKLRTEVLTRRYWQIQRIKLERERRHKKNKKSRAKGEEGRAVE
jgi:hypothetical protein